MIAGRLITVTPGRPDFSSESIALTHHSKAAQRDPFEMTSLWKQQEGPNGVSLCSQRVFASLQVIQTGRDTPLGLKKGIVANIWSGQSGYLIPEVENALASGDNVRQRRPYMRLIAGLLILTTVVVPLLAGEAEQERLDSSADAMEEILNIPDGLPKELLNKAECVAVMPS